MKKEYFMPAVKTGNLQAEQLLIGISGSDTEDGPGIGGGSGGGDDALSKETPVTLSIWDED